MVKSVFPFPISELHPAGGIGLGETYDDGARTYRLVDYASGEIVQANRIYEWTDRSAFRAGRAESGDTFLAGITPSGVETTTATAGDIGYQIIHGLGGVSMVSGISAIAAGELIAPAAAGQGQSGAIADASVIRAESALASGASSAVLPVDISIP